MTCKRIRGLLQAYLDKELSREDEGRVKNHLRSCESCRLEFSSLKTLDERLEKVELDVLSPSSRFTEEVISSLPTKRPTNFFENFRKILSVRPRWGSLAAISMILIAMVISLSLFSQKHSSSVVVQFNFEAPQASSVVLVGDFNGWEKGVCYLYDEDKDGIWTTRITLKPGQYQYLFIVDEQEIVADPVAQKYVNDGFGGRNSLLIVRDG